MLIHRLNALLRNKVYIIYTVGLCFTLPLQNAVMIAFIDIFVSKGYRKNDGVLLFLYMTIFSAVFRMISGFGKQIPGAL